MPTLAKLHLTTALALSCALASACGSSTPKRADNGAGEPTIVESDAQLAESPEQRFERQRLDTTGKMCERLVDCSLADARETMSPEELEELESQNAAAMAVQDCSKKYGGVALSPRQVIGIRECLTQPTECPAFNDCLDAAMRAPSE